MFCDEFLRRPHRYDEDYDEEEEKKPREIKPLGRDLSYVLASFLTYPKNEKHFTWDGEEIWPYSKRIEGVHIHVEQDNNFRDLKELSDEERRIAEEVTNAVREGTKDKTITCAPWVMHMKLTVEGASVDIEETDINGFLCTTEWRVRDSPKKAWAIAHTFAKKLENTEISKKYAIIPHVHDWNVTKTLYRGYFPSVKLVPKEEVPRFRSLLASLVDRVSRKPSPEEEIEGRIASLFEKL